MRELTEKTPYTEEGVYEWFEVEIVSDDRLWRRRLIVVVGGLLPSRTHMRLEVFDASMTMKRHIGAKALIETCEHGTEKQRALKVEWWHFAFLIVLIIGSVEFGDAVHIHHLNELTLEPLEFYAVEDGGGKF